MMSDSSSSEWLNFMHRIVKSPSLQTEPVKRVILKRYSVSDGKSSPGYKKKEKFNKELLFL